MNHSSQEFQEKNPTIKSTLTFFNTQLTALNTQRLQLNRSKGFAKYLAQSQNTLRSLAPLDTTLGVLSFTLYMARFAVNLGLLAQMMLDDEHTRTCEKNRRDLYYSLGNDCLWGIVNLTQFFWLSFNTSQSAGLYGVQLEVFAQLIDVMVMIIRFQESAEEYERQFKVASLAERRRMAIEWQHKELHLMRSLMAVLSITLVLGSFAFSIVAVPVSPLISAILLINAVLRVIIDAYKDKQLRAQLKQEGCPSEHIEQEYSLSTRDRLNDLNQVILYNVFVPLGLFLFLTTPFSLLVTSLLLMVFVHYLAASLIDTPAPNYPRLTA
ncbi:hypothetical protein [Legionella worsleiensis]|nr:hypothetical protein [Legionella worsleiensis]